MSEFRISPLCGKNLRMTVFYKAIAHSVRLSDDYGIH